MKPAPSLPRMVPCIENGGPIMVTEVAVFIAAAGKADELGAGIIKGLEVIRQHPECM